MAANGTNPPRFSDPELILAELERVLQSSAFCNSKRYPRFLRFIVEQTLLGNADLLKERVIGIEVFDRPPDYELATDPIVRVAAGEVRKRLAQYYIEDGHGSELRIQLQPGSYVPSFQLPNVSTVLDQDVSATPIPGGSPLEIAHNPASVDGNKKPLPAVVAALGLTIVLCFYIFNRPNSIDDFWQPFLKSGNSVLICLGDQGQYLPNGGNNEGAGLRTGVDSYDRLALGDVEALNDISTFLAGRGARTSVSNSRATSFADLCKQPVVLVGGFPNVWTMRYMKLLRFQLIANSSTYVNGILDTESPSRLRWSVDFRAPYTAIPAEYAIVARFHNPSTGMPSLIAAGLGAKGEVAAAQFLTTPAYLDEFASHAPRRWKERNIEIVLETQMINGASGPPHVVATYIW